MENDGRVDVKEIAKLLSMTPGVIKNHMNLLKYYLDLDLRPLQEEEVFRLIDMIKTQYGGGEWPVLNKKLPWKKICERLKLNRPYQMLMSTYRSMHPDSSLMVENEWSQIDDFVMLTKIMKLKPHHEVDVHFTTLSKNPLGCLKNRWKAFVNRSLPSQIIHGLSFPQLLIHLAKKYDLTREKRMELEKTPHFQNW